MKIGVIGSGVVGQTLAAGFLKHGHEVTIGTSHPDKLKDWTAKHAAAKVGTFAETARFGEVLVLAVLGSAALDALQAAGADAIGGKVVLDTTNPIGGGMPEKGVLSFFTTLKDSLMERLQKAYPRARFVKAFSSIGASTMVDPHFAAGKPTMFICGDDAAAKVTATSILDEFGWETADMGACVAARAIEPLCILWCIPGIANGDWGLRAFKLLR
jgi:8-hydroxy-5-deazaflavin:NADPH oxidoreductase